MQQAPSACNVVSVTSNVHARKLHVTSKVDALFFFFFFFSTGFTFDVSKMSDDGGFKCSYEHQRGNLPLENHSSKTQQRTQKEGRRGETVEECEKQRQVHLPPASSNQTSNCLSFNTKSVRHSGSLFQKLSDTDLCPFESQSSLLW